MSHSLDHEGENHLLRFFELRETCPPELAGKHAIIVGGKIVDTADSYESVLTVGYANYGLGEWMHIELKPLEPHEIRWRKAWLAAEAEYASWNPSAHQDKESRP